MAKKIVVIPGDGIGQEITAAAVTVLKKAAVKFSLDLEYEYHDAGGTAYDKYKNPLPEETLSCAKAADGVLFGAVGGDKWDKLPPESRPERAILGLRKGLGLYANLRPVKVADSLVNYSPLKPELVRGADFVIVRELVGGIYFGERSESEIKNGVESAYDVERYSVPEIERIAKIALEAAKLRRKKLTSVDKANVLASSRLWRRTVSRLAEKEPQVELNHLYVDNCAMQICSHPTQFDVILTNNIFGDILSDEAAVVGGSIGLSPSASLGDGTGMYEPIHGSAPDIAGKNIANPIGTILSAALLLRYSLKEEGAAKAIEAACDKYLADGLRTVDIWQEGKEKLSTTEAAAAIAERI